MLRLICGIISSWICICTYIYGEGRRDVIYISDLDSLETILGIWERENHFSTKNLRYDKS